MVAPHRLSAMAKIAGAAYALYEDEGEAPFIDAITDLLLQARVEGLDVDRIRRCAEMHYDAELCDVLDTITP